MIDYPRLDITKLSNRELGYLVRLYTNVARRSSRIKHHALVCA